jgi:hypothetical protein
MSYLQPIYIDKFNIFVNLMIFLLLMLGIFALFLFFRRNQLHILMITVLSYVGKNFLNIFLKPFRKSYFAKVSGGNFKQT